MYWTHACNGHDKGMLVRTRRRLSEGIYALCRGFKLYTYRFYNGQYFSGRSCITKSVLKKHFTESTEQEV